MYRLRSVWCCSSMQGSIRAGNSEDDPVICFTDYSDALCSHCSQLAPSFDPSNHLAVHHCRIRTSKPSCVDDVLGLDPVRVCPAQGGVECLQYFLSFLCTPELALIYKPESTSDHVAVRTSEVLPVRHESAFLTERMYPRYLGSISRESGSWQQCNFGVPDCPSLACDRIQTRWADDDR